MPHSHADIVLLTEEFSKSVKRLGQDVKAAKRRQLRDMENTNKVLQACMKRSNGSLSKASPDDLDKLFKALVKYYRDWIGPWPD